jgi:hypothetical protein
MAGTTRLRARYTPGLCVRTGNFDGNKALTVDVVTVIAKPKLINRPIFAALIPESDHVLSH